MKKFAWIKNEDDSIIKFHDYDDSWSPSSVSHKFGVDFLVRIIPYEIDDIPEFDPATQKVKNERVVLLTKVRDKKTVIALTPKEFAKIADNTDRDEKMARMRSKVAVLRGWAETARGVTVTSGNAVAVLQGVVDNLEKFYDAFADLIEGRRFDQ